MEKAISRTCKIDQPQIIGEGGVSRGIVTSTKTDIDYHLLSRKAYEYCSKDIGWSDVTKALVREIKKVLGFRYCRFVYNPRWLDFVYDNVVGKEIERPLKPDYLLFRILPEPPTNTNNTKRHATKVDITEVDLCIGKSDLFKQSGITYTKWFWNQPSELKEAVAKTIAEVKRKLRCNFFLKTKESPIKYGISVDSLVWQAGIEGKDYILPGMDSPKFVRHSLPSIELLTEGLKNEIQGWKKSIKSKALSTRHICYLMKDKPIHVKMFPSVTKQQIEQLIRFLKN
jgi:hypothetical protein